MSGLLLLLLLLFTPPLSLAAGEEQPPASAVVLLYHHVSDHTPAITSVTPDRFQEQLQYLADNQFQIWPLPEIIQRLQRRQALPDKVVAISFDDGYLSVYEHAYPLLKQRGWPFTVFVSTDAVDRQYPNHCNWQQLKTMQQHGAATIANHSSSHDHLAFRPGNESPGQWRERVRSDITKAQQRIEQELGSSPDLFAYPYGEFTPELKKIVAELGLIGLAQHSGALGITADFLALQRFAIAGNYADMESFALKAQSLPLPLRSATVDQAPLSFDQHKPQLQLNLTQPLPELACYGSGQGRLKRQWLNEEKSVVLFTANDSIPVGRSRYNCTAPAASGRFYWWSKSWYRKPADGSWVID
jgi:peptidoglycan/xylan/chitin deacetylase (PgdA/CDA1 family)